MLVQVGQRTALRSATWQRCAVPNATPYRLATAVAGTSGRACQYHTSSPIARPPQSNRENSRTASLWTRCGYPAAAATLGLLAHSTFSTSSFLHLDSGAKSASSSIFREASPVAPRRQGCQLVFVTVAEEKRDDWGSWIGYFREAGFDCIDLNLALEGVKPAAAADVQAFSEELHGQVRLMSLQRRPLLFAQTRQAALTALAQIQSRDPQMSGLVLVLDGKDANDGDKQDQSMSISAQIRNLDTKRMRILVVDDGQKDVLKNVERWMTDEGLL